MSVVTVQTGMVTSVVAISEVIIALSHVSLTTLQTARRLGLLPHHPSALECKHLMLS